MFTTRYFNAAKGFSIMFYRHHEDTIVLNHWSWARDWWGCNNRFHVHTDQ